MSAPTTTWRPLDPSYWTFTTAFTPLNNSTFLQYNSNFYVIDPANITLLGYTKTSVLSVVDMLTFDTSQTSPTFATPHSTNSYTQSAWNSGSWNITSAANFVHDVGIFVQNNFATGTQINPTYTNINILLLFGKVKTLDLALPIIYPGDDALGVST